MGMNDDRVIAIRPEPVRYRVHHVYDGSARAGKPMGSAQRAVRLTVVEYWTKQTIQIIHLASGHSLGASPDGGAYHATVVNEWEQPLLPEEEPPIPVPNNYRWECDVPDGVVKLPLLQIISEYPGWSGVAYP